MKILWFVPVSLSAVCQQLGLSPDGGGWWIESLMIALLRNPNIELGIVWSSRDVHQAQHFIQQGVHYYCLPEGEQGLHRRGKIRRLFEISGFNHSLTNSLLDACANVISDFKPDVIHVHGSEKPYGRIGEVIDIPIILSIQGILTEYIKVYFGQLGFGRRLAIPEVLYGYLIMRRRAMLERQIFRACKYFAGRTLWDQSHQAVLNPNGHFFSCGELMRPEFYHAQWSLAQAKIYAIYTTTSCLPYKGIDTLLDAVAILTHRFPDVCLRIGGNIPNRGYGGELRRKARTLGMEDRVEFLGWLPAEKIADELTRAHVFVIPSFIENSPNSLAEAQLVGTPVVASSAGGIPSMVSNNETGLLFPPGDVAVLAMQIGIMFDGNDLALQCSEQARQAAFTRHDEATVVSSFIHAYDEISQGTACKQNEK